MIRCILFDLGETLTELMIDDLLPLDELPLVAFADAIATVGKLKDEGYKLAVVSNTCQSGDAAVIRALAKIGLSHFFDAVVTSVDSGSAKPSPEIFLKALWLVDCRANESIMVGDNPVNDIDGAAKLGISTIIIQRGEMAAAPGVFRASFTVSSLSEIPTIIGRM